MGMGVDNFPIWMEACDGNASDKAALQATAARMEAFCKVLQDSPGDSAMLWTRCKRRY